MTGTFINVAAILISGTIGLFSAPVFPKDSKNTVIASMGLFTAAMGLKCSLKVKFIDRTRCIDHWRTAWRVDRHRRRLAILWADARKRFSSDSETGSRFQICTRLYGLFIALLHWTNGDPWLDSRRPEWKL
ncbi:MAG: DUF554 family protein [Anaerolineales bacterium]|nr:DUF554 family protein [Anaerolineales bacterium]